MPASPFFFRYQLLQSSAEQITRHARDGPSICSVSRRVMQLCCHEVRTGQSWELGCKFFASLNAYVSMYWSVVENSSPCGSGTAPLAYVHSDTIRLEITLQRRQQIQSTLSIADRTPLSFERWARGRDRSVFRRVSLGVVCPTDHPINRIIHRKMKDHIDIMWDRLCIRFQTPSGFLTVTHLPEAGSLANGQFLDSHANAHSASS